MQSWKIRLGLMLAMLAMLLMVSVPVAVADEDKWDDGHWLSENWDGDHEDWDGDHEDEDFDDYVALYAVEYDEGDVDDVEFLGYFPEDLVEDAEDFGGEWWD